MLNTYIHSPKAVTKEKRVSVFFKIEGKGFAG